MNGSLRLGVAAACALGIAPIAGAESAAAQTETDEYTRYELLAPETASFKIYYEVTATTPGAKYFYNPIRKGSTATDESVHDAMLGKPLHFQVVSGIEARKDPLMPDADPATDYIKVTLARPVPENGQAQAGQTLRLRISETYTAPSSYGLDGEELVFDRSLGRPRNAVVLPPGWYCTFSSIPATVSQLPDGTVRLDYWNDRPEPVDVLLKGKRRADPARGVDR